MPSKFIPAPQVAIEHWGGPGTLAGRVRRVEPAAFTKISTLGVEEQRVNVLIDIVSPAKDWAGLGDAYQVDTRITVFSRDDATIVPAGALFRTGETLERLCGQRRTRAASRGDAVAAIRPLAAVTAGVQPGDRVIVYPSDRIAPGVRVDAR